MNSNTFESKLLRDRENYNEWAKWIYFQLQEKHPDASRLMVWEEKSPEKEVLMKRIEESNILSRICKEPLENDEAKIKDPELFKFHLLKLERRNKTRGMVTSAIGFIQQRISSDCLQLIKHTEEAYNKAIEDYDLYSMWEAINKAMKPKEMMMAMKAAKVLIEIASMKQEGDESINNYNTKFSNKIDELSSIEGINIKQSVLSCLYANGLNETFTSFKNHIQNLKEADMDFMKTREAALRWATTEEGNGNVFASVSYKGPMKKYDKSKVKSTEKKVNQNKKGCYICKETTHFFKDCPKLKAIAAAATNTPTPSSLSNNADKKGKQHENNDLEESASYHSA